MNERIRLLVTLGFAAAFVGGIAVGRLPERTAPVSVPSADGTGLPSPISGNRIREVWDVLHEKFSGKLDDAQLATGILRGLAAGTGDAYTVFADPQESKQFGEDLGGSFSGIGIEIGLRRGLVTVIAPLRGSPAERAGIRAKDVIINIDGKDLEQRPSLTEVVSRIRGKAGTTVTITVAREGESDPLAFTVGRERIQIESVKLQVRDELAIVTLSSFNDDTAKRFGTMAREIRARGARGILLDLRNNPGGLLESSVEVAGYFLPRETLVVREVPREGLERTEHRTRGPATLRELPTVVLINGGSASAAEILAAALNEHRDVPLVGTVTFGKGSVQELVELSDASTLHVTIARWHTPKGKEISEDGILPSVEVKDEKPEEDPDEILEKGLALLQQRATR